MPNAEQTIRPLATSTVGTVVDTRRPSRGPLIEDILAHLALLAIAFDRALSDRLDRFRCRSIRATSPGRRSLDLIPPGASLDAFKRC